MSINTDKYACSVQSFEVKYVNSSKMYFNCICNKCWAVVLMDHALRHRAQNADVVVATPRIAAQAPPEVAARHARPAPVENPDPDEA